MGSSLKCLRAFPADARRDVSYQIEALQQGGQPADFKPMPSVGKDVEEIRVQEAGCDLKTARERFAQLKRMLP